MGAAGIQGHHSAPQRLVARPLGEGACVPGAGAEQSPDFGGDRRVIDTHMGQD